MEEEPNSTTKFSSLRGYLRVVFPHLAMVIISSLYTLMGATAFYLVEGPHERQTRLMHLGLINDSRLTFADHLWDSQNAQSEDSWKSLGHERLDNLTAVLFRAFTDRCITLHDVRTELRGDVIGDNQWTLAAAIFFAATTITTIGYGNLVPMTQEGRIMCVAFAVVGVPLMLVTIGDLGRILSDILTILYEKYRRLTMSTRRKLSNTLMQHQSDIQQDLLELVAINEEALSVPVPVVLFILLAYTALGGLLLGVWEMGWSFFDSFYFSFISVTTVGFGDFAPKQESYYAATLVYILFGLAITTMCVDLVGCKYIEKIHNFGRRIGAARNRLRTLGDVIYWATFLQRRFALTDEQVINMQLPDDAQLETILASAYVPEGEDLRKWRFIDQRRESWWNTLLMSTNTESLSDIGGMERTASLSQDYTA